MIQHGSVTVVPRADARVSGKVVALSLYINLARRLAAAISTHLMLHGANTNGLNERCIKYSRTLEIRFQRVSSTFRYTTNSGPMP